MTVTAVTGASSGIGRSLARRLARAGDPVALLARREPLLVSLAQEIEAEDGTAVAIACDVTDRDAVTAAFGEAQERLGPIERLVANAGGGEPTFAESFRAEQIAQVIALNTFGTANCIEAVLPGMLERGSGHLVAVSSPVAFRGMPTGAAYSAAKAALTNMMESLRIDVGPQGIDVTLLFPGFVQTNPSQGLKSRGKPFRVDLEDATRVMHRAIEERTTRLVFPPSIALLSLGSRLLPDRLYDRFMHGRGRTPD